MARDLTAYSPEAEVQSELVLGVLDAMGAFRSIATEILAEHGIEQPRPGLWYPMRAWLAALESVYKRIGPSTLFQIARQIPASATIPDEIDTIEKALAGLDHAYRSAHRGGDVGSYTYVRVGERAAKIVCRNPYPCEFDHRIIEALARRFEPDNVYLSVQHDDPTHCKKVGADACIYSVSW